MPHDWDDWEKWRKRHRHGRPDWSRPGRGKGRPERREARDDVRHAHARGARRGAPTGCAMAREEIRERRRSRRRGRELTPEEEAHRIAEHKIKFFQHLVSYVFVILFLLFVTKQRVRRDDRRAWAGASASRRTRSR